MANKESIDYSNLLRPLIFPYSGRPAIVEGSCGGHAKMGHNGVGAAIKASPTTIFISIKSVQAEVRTYSTHGFTLAQQNTIVIFCWPSPFQRPTRGSRQVKHTLIRTPLCSLEHTEAGKCLSMFI